MPLPCRLEAQLFLRIQLSLSGQIHFMPFMDWFKAEKVTEISVKEEESVALLYSGENEAIMEGFATYISKDLKYNVITAHHIYERETGKEIAFQSKRVS
jgi:hypothetical protein